MSDGSPGKVLVIVDSVAGITNAAYAAVAVALAALVVAARLHQDPARDAGS